MVCFLVSKICTYCAFAAASAANNGHPLTCIEHKIDILYNIRAIECVSYCYVAKLNAAAPRPVGRDCTLQRISIHNVSIFLLLSLFTRFLRRKLGVFRDAVKLVRCQYAPIT